MIPIRNLSNEDIISILDMKGTIKSVEKAYLIKNSHTSKIFPIISEALANERSEMDIKSGFLAEDNIYGLKMVSWFGENTNYDLPTITGLLMISDLKNGLPKAILNASYITAMRTGAAGAIGIKYLANPYPESLLIIGTGNQAKFQIAASLSIAPSIKNVYVYNPKISDKAYTFVDEIIGNLMTITEDNEKPDNKEWIKKISSTNFVAIDYTNDIINSIDAVITATPANNPLIFHKDLPPGVHISCIGADIIGKQEIDPFIFKRAVVYADDRTQSAKFGECQNPIRENLISDIDIKEIGDLISKEELGRTSNKDVTIFDSTGIALQDLVVANYVIKQAEYRNIGTITHM
jgi:ornithine cyclodeaminase/alanine dehydrogenase